MCIRDRYKPGAYAYLGTGNPDLPHTMITNHNGGFDVDENALVTGAGLYVGLSLIHISSCKTMSENYQLSLTL